MEELLKTILMEARNLSYLFFGFAVIWLFLFAYMYSLSRRENDLQHEIERLKAERREDDMQYEIGRMKPDRREERLRIGD
jgi:CcmD family protein